jgi:hypothetical protein
VDRESGTTVPGGASSLVPKLMGHLDRGHGDDKLMGTGEEDGAG